MLVVLSACWLVYDLDAELGEGGEVFPFVDSYVPCFEGVGSGDLHGGLFLLVCDACELVCDFLEGFVHGVFAFSWVLRTGVGPVIGREPREGKSPTCLAGPKRVPLLEWRGAVHESPWWAAQVTVSTAW